jgi:transposase-like protein
MSHLYLPEEKAHALDLLHEHNGNVSYVSYLTGISERTLYTWRRHQKYAIAEQEGYPQPKHWVRQHPERQERLQQQKEKRSQLQQQQQKITAFGITQAELEEAMKVEYIPSPYTNLHADMLLHLQHLNFSLTDDPETAHIKALAFSRILGDVLKLEELVRIEKPQLSLFKYEYPDKTYHDVPYWSNAVYERATQAYEAVLAEAKRQYEEQQAALNPQPDTPEISPSPSLTSDMEELDNQPTVEELLAMPFQPEDFTPRHTGFHKYFLGEDPYARFKDSPTPNDESTDDSS